MHFVCSYTSGYFPIYGDEYRRIYYDNDDTDDHVLYDTQGLLTFRRRYEQLAQL